MQSVIVFYPLLIGKYKRSSLKANTVFVDVDSVLIVIPLDKRFSNCGFHRFSITRSITFVNGNTWHVEVVINVRNLAGYGRIAFIEQR